MPVRRVDSIQQAPTPDLPPAERDAAYWDELNRVTLHAVRLRGRELKALGLVTLMRFGPLEGDRRRIEGGALVAAPGGTIGWERDGDLTRVAVRGYAPRMPRPLYAFQSFVHVALSRRYLRRLRNR